MRLARLILCLLVASLFAGCSHVAGEQAQAGSPIVLDVKRGTYRGVQAGDSRREVRRRLGRTRCADSSITPLGEDYYEIGGPSTSNYRNPAHDKLPFEPCILRYRSVSVTADPRDGVWLIITTHPRAQTDRGMGVGDSADLVKQRYPRADCRPADNSFDGDSPPGACTVEYGKARGFEADPPLVLTFGLDPAGQKVRSIWLNPTTPQAIKKLRRAK